MPATEIPLTVERFNKAFEYLTTQLAKMPAEAQRKVQAALNKRVGKVVLLAAYHNSSAYDMQSKYDFYKECFQALVDNKLDQLGGDVGVGDKRFDALADAQPEPAKAAAATYLPPSPRAPAAPQVVTIPDNADPLTRAILQAVAPYLPQGGATAAGVDEEQVESVTKRIISEVFMDFEKDGFKKLLDKHMGNGSFPTDRVKELFNELAANLVKRIEFVTPSGEVKPIDGLVHPQVTQFACWLLAGVPVWGWGAAGAGKTHMVRQIAVIIGVTPYVISIDPTITVNKLLGYRNVTNGEFVEGLLYQAYKNGGLVGFDEIDTGDPGVIASLNALLSNEHYLFPNGETVARHPKFYTIAMANTKGTGAVAGYTARNRLDAATLDRFAVIETKYDAGLESALACGEGAPSAPWMNGTAASQATQKAYVEWVQKVRKEFGNSVLISPRASINGCKALRAGVPLVEVVDALVFKLCASDTVNRIKDKCGMPEVA